MMSTLHDEAVHNDVAASGPTTRVAIREIREAAFRALVAVGASPAEAKVASEQVLFDELHRGTGLVGLLGELSCGPWARMGMACERDHTHQPPTVRVFGTEGSSALRQGALLADLLAVEKPGTLVLAQDLSAVSSLLDEPLIRTARSTGSFVVAAHRTPESVDLRVAAPDGSIGASWSSTGPEALPLGVSLARREAGPRSPTTWLTADQQRFTRAAAAQHGQQVDAARWAQVVTAARTYLVPEQ